MGKRVLYPGDGFDLNLSYAFFLFVLSAALLQTVLSGFSSPFLHVDSSEYLANAMWLAGFHDIKRWASHRNIGFSLLASLFVVFQLPEFIWLLPLFFKVYSLISLFLLSRTLFPLCRDIWILSTILLTFNWHYTWWGNTLLTTVPATTLLLTAITCLYRWHSNRERRYLYLTILISVACFYIRYLQGIILLLFTGLFLIMTGSIQTSKDRDMLVKILILLASLLSPWYLFNWKYFQNPTYGITRYYLVKLMGRTRLPLDPFYYVRMTSFLISIPCSLMAIIGSIDLMRKRVFEDLRPLLIVWLIFIYSAMSITLTREDRYVTFFTPFLLVVCSLGLKTVRRKSFSLFIIAFLLCSISTADYYSMLFVRISDFTMREPPIYLGAQRIISIQGGTALNLRIHHAGYHIAAVKDPSTTMYIFHVQGGKLTHIRFLAHIALKSGISLAPQDASNRPDFQKVYSNGQYLIYCRTSR
jgi:4-amino-4-deoxy-L-arabinose transferase-like glycosyltransferase